MYTDVFFKNFKLFFYKSFGLVKASSVLLIFFTTIFWGLQLYKLASNVGSIMFLVTFVQ